ncbi:DUF4329 domain-containing protein [Cribrihabitans marinus]|nr:DUF4329 domain-containing protein [Cribrihabitans marinus]
MRRGITGAMVLALAAAAACADPTLPDRSEIDAVIARLEPIQQLTFATGFEYCGYLGQTRDRQLVFTTMQRGGHDGCTPIMPDEDVEMIASMHTHGTYDPGVPAEFPSVIDLESDRREGVNGYVATPGGRLWYIDSKVMVAVQLCGPGCLPQDPAFRPGDDGEIAARYSLAELAALEARE